MNRLEGMNFFLVVEMDVARLRALTHPLLLLHPQHYLRRNGCSPFEGIDTSTSSFEYGTFFL